MSDSEDAFERTIQELRKLNDDALADVEQRLAVLEAARLRGTIPLLPVTGDTTDRGTHTARLEFLKRRLERLEREMYQHNLRERP